MLRDRMLRHRKGKTEMNMKYVDIAVSLLFVIGMVVIYFFWGCHLDLYVTILAAVIFLAAGLVKIVQYKKLKELTPEDGVKR